MSTSVWPPLGRDQLNKEEQISQVRELNWLLSSLQETLTSLKSGLEECASLLSPANGASTLVLSSLRSENIKGFITRVGTRIVKGDISIRIPGLPNSRSSGHKLSISSAPEAPTLVLAQLTTVRALIDSCLDVVDVSTWTGDARNASFIAGQFRLLSESIQEARQTLKGTIPFKRQWWEDPIDSEVFDPPCPANLSFHLSLSDAALVLYVRTLELASSLGTPDSFTGFGIRERFAVAIGAARAPSHDEVSDVFAFQGIDVRVKEKVRIETQDPSLLAVMAKLSALEHSVAMSRNALNTIMGREES